MDGRVGGCRSEAPACCSVETSTYLLIEIFSRYVPVIEPRLGFRSSDVVEVLERLGSEIGFPATIRVGEGGEFISRDLDLWAYQRCRARLLTSRQAHGGYSESLNGKCNPTASTPTGS